MIIWFLFHTSFAQGLLLSLFHSGISPCVLEGPYEILGMNSGWLHLRKHSTLSMLLIWPRDSIVFFFFFKTQFLYSNMDPMPALHCENLTSAPSTALFSLSIWWLEVIYIWLWHLHQCLSGVTTQLWFVEDSGSSTSSAHDFPWSHTPSPERRLIKS